jgi:hypothetical protein
MSGLAATLRQAEPGTRVRLVMDDGSEVAGALGRVNGETVDLDDGDQHIELRNVKRMNLEFSSPPRSRAQGKRAA